MSGRPPLPPPSQLSSDHDGPPPSVLPTRRDGKPKSRLSWDEKLHVLDPLSPVEMTKSRLRAFAKLFASRAEQAIATLVGQGPRMWTTLRCPLTYKHIARHLLVDRIPSLYPQWVGSKSNSSSLFLCIDVDPDRNPKDPNGSFRNRRLGVERALRKMGIDVRDPRQVLIRPTPSGGLHYYVFFDESNPIEEYHALLRAAGLKHKPGHVEFFPSETHGLRLPFGHIPGGDHDPRAWVQFIDDYENGRIRRHSLKVLADRLRRGGKPSPGGKPIREKPSAKVEVGNRKFLGIPKRLQTRTPGSRPKDTEFQVRRYMDLMENGIRSFQDAKNLERLGIRIPGTRNWALNQLAAHHIWVLHETAEQAAGHLLRWSMDGRHDSKDIRSDLEKGTNIVANQLGYMCPWYETHKRVVQAPLRIFDRDKLYAPEELEALRPSVLALPESDRLPQAQFLLEFLSYAKRNGWSALDASGWEAAVAVIEVIRKWPGCRGKNNYKFRIDRAKESGILRVVREKWHNHDGPGRPRTYRLSVPVIAPGEASVGYDHALTYLTGQSNLVMEPAPSKHEQDEAPRRREHGPSHEQPGDGPARRQDHPRHSRPGCSPGHLGQAAHQRHPQWAPSQALSDPGPRFGRTLLNRQARSVTSQLGAISRSGVPDDSLMARTGCIQPGQVRKLSGPKFYRNRPIPNPPPLDSPKALRHCLSEGPSGVTGGLFGAPPRPG